MLLALAYALVGILALLGVFRHPGWALFGYYVVAFLRPGELDWLLSTGRFSLPLVAAALAGTGLYILRTGWPKVRSDQMWIAVAMLAHFWIATWWLKRSGANLDTVSLDAKLSIYTNMFIVMFVATRVLNELRWVHQLLWGLAFCGGFLAVWANYQYFRNGWYPITGPGPHIGLYGGIFADRNDFGMFLAMSIILCWYMNVLSRRWWLKAAWMGCIPMIVHAILMTEGRGALLGGVLACGYIVWRSPRRKLMAIGMVAGIIFSALLLVNDRMLERYGSINDYQQDASALSRKNTWNIGQKMMVEHPFVGVGISNFTHRFYEFSNWRPKWTQIEGEWVIIRDFDYYVNEAHEAHNMWFQRGGESGLTGFLILLAFVVSIFLAVRRSRRLLRGLRDMGAGRAPPEEELERAHVLANILEGVMIPYLLTAYFLSMEDFEGLYIVGALAGCLQGALVLMTREAEARDALPQSDEAPSSSGDPAAPRRRPPPRRGPRAPLAQNPILSTGTQMFMRALRITGINTLPGVKRITGQLATPEGERDTADAAGRIDPEALRARRDAMQAADPAEVETAPPAPAASPLLPRNPDEAVAGVKAARQRPPGRFKALLPHPDAPPEPAAGDQATELLASIAAPPGRAWAEVNPRHGSSSGSQDGSTTPAHSDAIEVTAPELDALPDTQPPPAAQPVFAVPAPSADLETTEMQQPDPEDGYRTVLDLGAVSEFLKGRTRHTGDGDETLVLRPEVLEALRARPAEDATLPFGPEVVRALRQMPAEDATVPLGPEVLRALRAEAPDTGDADDDDDSGSS